ncbi:DUF177 domain-containing protein [Acetobacteraceae bacterium]|nr:DUF177 domain-containing protein [Acetobacteraceae bacterium]
MQKNTQAISGSEKNTSQSVLIAKLFPGYIKEIVATETEREQVSNDFSLEALNILRCSFEVESICGAKITVVGKLEAEFPQHCVVTNAIIKQKINNIFKIVFLPQVESSKEGLSMSHTDLAGEDFVYYEGEHLPLWETLLEQFALEIPAYPRVDDKETFSLISKNSASEEDCKASPFAALKNFPFKSK